MPVPKHTLSSHSTLHAPRAKSSIKAVVEPLQIQVKDPLDHYAPALLHVRSDMVQHGQSEGAVVLVSGAGGGVSGPGGKLTTLDFVRKVFHVGVDGENAVQLDDDDLASSRGQLR